MIAISQTTIALTHPPSRITLATGTPSRASTTSSRDFEALPRRLAPLGYLATERATIRNGYILPGPLASPAEGPLLMPSLAAS